MPFKVTASQVAKRTTRTLSDFGYKEVQNHKAWPKEVPVLTGNDIFIGRTGKGEKQTLFFWSYHTFGDLAAAVQWFYTTLLVEVDRSARIIEVSPAAQARLWNQTMSILGYTEDVE